MVDMENLIINGSGINSTYNNGSWLIDANSGAVIIEDIIPHVGDAISKGESIQTVFNQLFSDILPKIPVIDFATMFKTNEDGLDLEYPDVKGLNKESIYIRITFINSDIPLYISCWLLQSDIESLRYLVNSKADKTEYELLKLEVENKVSTIQLEYIQELINTKADKSQINNLQTIIDKKANLDYVSNLESIIYNKADKSSLISIEADINNINKTLDDFVSDDEISNLSETIQNINKTLNDKANKSEIITLNNSLNNKVNKSELDDINKRFEQFENLNISDLVTKLNSLTLSISKLNKKMEDNTSELKKKSDLSYVERIDTELKKATTRLDAAINTKANRSELSLKANKSDLDALSNTNSIMNSNLTQVKNELKLKASNAELNNKYDELKHTINDHHIVHRNDIKLLNTSLSRVQKNVDDIDNKLDNINDLAKREWIQVLTPEQYKRIPSSRIDPAKLYMCVKFGKPFALYIGSVLIAERNTTESTGFAYAFPLTF